MITGFNTDIEYDGVTYHVQTEDKGLETPLILSLVYVGGAILASKRTSYSDLIDAGFDDSILAERLQRQHKLICAAIRAGRIEDLKRMSETSRAAASPSAGQSHTAQLDDIKELLVPVHEFDAAQYQPDTASPTKPLSRPISLFEFPKQMKSDQEKIKDFVAPQPFDEMQNPAADPARALATYRFTDATSDLLVRWLDMLADMSRGRSAARALAGSRGVGKSHVLAAFSAIAASPELRTKISDVRVATSARRLTNRRYIIVRVERGTRQTLLGEVAAAFNTAFGVRKATWGSNPASMLISAVSHSSDAIPLIIIDTPVGRTTRVGRDDGPLLSELAAATKHVNAFVGLALDDDIADASGPNAAITRSFQIDYLDPENLERVAEQHILRKNMQARSSLHSFYTALRASVPGFNWSEPRFTALYPVHPLVADVSASVRLYAPTFAFLPFAAAAALRAAGRPALSLILLDEVFDRAEYDLRRAPELAEAFAAYDELAGRVVGEFPVMQRLQAKLVLKSLFILSLEGRGATATEMCGALLFYDETSPVIAIERLDEALRRFAEEAPERVARSEDGGSEARYRFLIGAAGADSGTAARGEAAVGGAPSQATPEAFRVSLLDDEGDFRAGELVTMRVYVGRGPEAEVPVSDASIIVKVLGTSFRPLILTTVTDQSGIAVVRALLPRFTSGRAAILIRASAEGYEAELRRVIQQA